VKTVAVIGLVVGLALGMALVGYFGFAAVGRALLAIGWFGFLVTVVYHVGLIALLGVCWYLLAPQGAPAKPFLWGRLIRDSGSEVLPVSQLGGLVVGVRAAMLLGLSAAVTIASMIVDATLELCGQLAYAAVGLAVLMWRQPEEHSAGWIAVGLLIALFVTVIFVLLQWHGVGFAERTARRLLGQSNIGVIAGVQPIQGEIRAIYRRARSLRLAFLLHFAIWLASGVEAWIALSFMGVAIDLWSVLAIESLLYAIRSAAFAVPGALGVQEGSLVMLGALFGLPPETALALSLLKRGRDMVIGVPALLAWQLMESGRLWRRRSAAGV
jgi:putative membrane protein